MLSSLGRRRQWKTRAPALVAEHVHASSTARRALDEKSATSKLTPSRFVILYGYKHITVIEQLQVLQYYGLQVQVGSFIACIL